jgi:phosphate starvation-inducible protein PhoH and related proteins
MTAPKKQQKTFKIDDIIEVKPKTKNQRKAFDSFDKGRNLVLSGVAGAGKTLIALYLGTELVLDRSTPYEKLIIVRSVVPTRDIGFLPGTKEEKIDVYKAPYKSLFATIFNDKTAYDSLEKSGKVFFETTSFIRGLTFEDSVIIVDEFQNLNGHENDSVITRLGNNCRIIFAGDFYQSDFSREREKFGSMQFVSILRKSAYFDVIEFGLDDILRSDLVKDYLIAKENEKRNNPDIDW